jgi:hypothetical protein
MADNELKFVVSMQDKASGAAKNLLKTMQGFNTTVVTRVNLALNNGAITKLRSALKSLRDETGSISVGTFTKPFELLEKKLMAMKGALADVLKPPDDRSLMGWANKLTGIMKGLATTGLLVEGAFAAAGATIAVIGGMLMKKWVDQSIELNSNMETYQIQLQTTIGSLTAAKKEMAGIVTFAKQTPFEIKEITNAVVKLRAYKMDTKTWLESLGDMAAAFGRPVTDAVEAAADAAMGQFRRSLSYGIKMERADFKDGGKYAGMEYGDAFLMEVKKRFAGGMKLQSGTFKGLTSNIKDVMSMGLVEMGKPIFDKAKETIEKVYKLMQSKRATDAIASITESVREAVNSISTAVGPVVSLLTSSILPTVAEIGINLVQVFLNFSKILAGPVFKSLTAILMPILKLLMYVTDLSAKTAWVTKILLGLGAARVVFKLLTAGAFETAVSLTQLGATGSIVATQLSIIAKRAALVAGSFIAMNLIATAFTVKDRIREIGDELKTVDGSIENSGVKKYLNDLADSSGRSVAELSEAALVAVEFGTNSQSVLEVAANSAEELGTNSVQAADLIGKLSANFVKLGDSSEVARQKTEDTANALIYITKNQKELGVDVEKVKGLFEEYPAVLSNIAGGWESIVNLLKAAGGDANKLRNVFEGMEMLMNPDETMLKELPANTWIGRSTEEMMNMGKVMEELSKTKMGEAITQDFGEMAKEISESGKAIADTINNYDKAVKKSSYTIEDAIDVYKMLSTDLTVLKGREEEFSSAIDENTETIDANKDRLSQISIRLTEIGTQLEALSSLEPTGFKAYEDRIFSLDQTIDSLTLDKTRVELDNLNNSFADQERTISELESAIESAEESLEPLKNELESVKEEFESISAAISDAQDKLDKFTEPKLKGMTEFDDKLNSIDNQLNLLKRQKMDMKNPLEGIAALDPAVKDSNIYKQYQAQIDAVDRQIASLEDTKDKVKLDRKIAYDDQLYQLKKIGDMEQEITFEDAVAGATAARDAIETLTPKLEEVESRKNALEDMVEQRQAEIDQQKEILDSKKDELAAAKAIRDAAAEDLQTQISRLEYIKQIEELEWSINNAQLIRARDQAIKGPVAEGLSYGSVDQITSLTGEKNTLTAEQANLSAANAKLEYLNEQMNTTLGEIQAEITVTEDKMGTIIKNLPNMITGIDAVVLFNVEKGVLETVFGTDIATVISGMSANLATIAANGGTPGVTGENGAGSGGERGVIGKIQDFFAGNTWATVATAAVGGAALQFFGGKGIKAGAKAVGGVLQKGKPGMFDEVAGTVPKGKLETAAVSKATKQVDEVATKLYERFEKAGLEGAAKGKTDLFDDAVKMQTKVKELADAGNLKGLNAIEKEYTTIEKVAGKGKTSKVAGSALDKATGGLLSIEPVKKTIKSVQNLLSGKGGIITNTRGAMYSGAKVLGNVSSVAKGTVGERLGSLIGGRQISSKVMGPLRKFMGGKGNIVAGGGMKGMLPLLAISGLMGAGEGVGGAAESVASMGAYMGVSKGGEKILGKVLGKGAGKLVPILGQIGMIGDLAGMLEGAIGKDLGSVAGGAAEKAGGWLGFKDKGKGLGDTTSEAVNGAVDTAQNISGVFTGLAGGLVGLGKGIFTGDWSYLKDSMSELWDNLKMIPENILKAIGGALGTVMEIGEEIFGKITEPFSKAWGWLVENFAVAAWLDEKVIQPVIGFLSGAWAGIKDFLKDPWNNFKEFLFAEDGIQSWPGKILEWLGSIVSWLGDVWASISGALSGPFSDAWNWISTNVSTWFNSIIGWLKGIPEWFGDTWNSITEKVKSPFVAAWNWLSDPQNGIASWPGKILGWIQSIPNKLTEAWGSLKEMGRQMIAAIGEGLSEAWEKIKTLPGISQLLTVIEKVGGAASSVLNTVGEAIGFADGGIATGPKSGYMELLHGTEAVIPLKNGSVPVQLSGALTGMDKGDTAVYNNSNTVNVSEGAFTFIVRDDDDIEDIKKAILALREGQVGFMDSPRFYSERY